MSQALALLEFKTIPKGIEATDAMLKAAAVSVVFSSPICPGKFISIIAGEVDAVSSALTAGQEVGGPFLIDSYLIPSVHEKVVPALTGTSFSEEVAALGIIETMSAISSMLAGDIVSKAATVELIEIRLARGLGGKGFVIFSGDVGSVEMALKACGSGSEIDGTIVSAVCIPRPHKDLIPTLF